MKPLAGQVTFRGILGIFWSPTAPSEVAGVVGDQKIPGSARFTEQISQRRIRFH
jgi:hypothetical protein